MNAMELQRLIFILQLTIGVARSLDRGSIPRITCNEIIRDFQKRKFLWNKDIVKQRYRRSFCAKKKIRSCGLVSQKKKVKMFTLGDVLSKLV